MHTGIAWCTVNLWEAMSWTWATCRVGRSLGFEEEASKWSFSLDQINYFPCTEGTISMAGQKPLQWLHYRGWAFSNPSESMPCSVRPEYHAGIYYFAVKKKSAH